MYLRATPRYASKQQSSAPVRPCSMLVVPEDSRPQDVKNFELFVGSMMRLSSLAPPPLPRRSKVAKNQPLQLPPKVSHPTPTISSHSISQPAVIECKLGINNSKKIAPARQSIAKLELSTVLEERDSDFFSSTEAIVRGLVRHAPFGLEDLEVADVEVGLTRKQVQEGKRRREELEAKRLMLEWGDETRRCGPKFKAFDIPDTRAGKSINAVDSDAPKPSLLSFFSTSSMDDTRKLEDDPNLPIEHKATRSSTRRSLPKSHSLNLLFTLRLSRHRVDSARTRTRSRSLPSVFASDPVERDLDERPRSKVVVFTSSEEVVAPRLKEKNVSEILGGSPVTIKSSRTDQSDSDDEASTPSSSASDEQHRNLSRRTSYSSLGSGYAPVDPITPFLLNPTSKRQIDFTPPSRPPPPPLPYDEWERELSEGKRASKKVWVWG